ncbi:glycosyltransferase family 39 protein [Roseovarius pacificus]|uniref:glycosyltransferase family 39 protein n=1 Tax=Roseovarius pacificus TaxID=337701 RepID=UPI002A18BE9E|nr:glycosyltransferase family 39 protein [Roseovarius pacificus]
MISMATGAQTPKTPFNWDALIAGVLFVVFSLGGWLFLNGYGLTPGTRFGDDPMMFQPAVGIAAGMGYSTIMLHAPGAEDFFTGQSDSLNLDLVRDPQYYMPATGKFDLDRVYLLTAIGWIWRVTGVHWWAVWILPSVFLGLLAVATYGIFRLAARPSISVVGTCLALFSPVVLDILPGVRDFCKGPFVLFAILFCGLVIRGVFSRKQRLVACAFMGLFIGVGIGFRQDSIVCLPPVIGCLLLAPAKGRWPLRFVDVAILLVAFLLPAWPILRMNSNSGGNNAFYLLQGFSEYSLDDLDLIPASYTPIPSHGDYNVHAAISAYADAQGFDFGQYLLTAQVGLQVRSVALGQTMPWHPAVTLPNLVEVDPFEIWSYGPEQIARHYVWNLINTFPADVLTRAYGSVLRIVRGDIPQGTRPESYLGLFEKINVLRRPMIHFLLYFGPLFLLVTFLAMAAQRPWQAFLALGVTLFFLGYPSLSSQPRHVYHLYFACLWFPAFILEGLWRAPSWRREGLTPERKAAIRRALPRVLIFSVVVGSLLAVPLWGARLWQAHAVSGLKSRYASVRLEPLEYQLRQEADLTTVCLPDTSNFFHDLNRPLSLDDVLSGWKRPYIEAEYLVADLECSQDYASALVAHEDRAVLFDFETTRRFPLQSVPVTVRLFVPVFGFSEKQTAYGGRPISPFNSITFNNGTHVKGLYRVTNINDFPMLMTLWLPEDPALFEGAYRLRWLPNPRWFMLFPQLLPPHEPEVSGVGDAVGERAQGK